jgi:ribosome biogenesis GTPase / thiamine phosphate phosphatase
MTPPTSPVDPTGVLGDLGADASRLEQLAAAVAAAPSPSQPGRVSRSERIGADVLTPEGSILATTTETVCTGDWVVVDRSGDPPRIVAILDRRTALVRRAADDESGQLLATNVDEIWIVTPLDRPIAPERVERALVLAWESGAVPVLVATKADLATADEIADAVGLLGSTGPGTSVVVVSTSTDAGVDELVARLGRGRSVALLGASGAGKSSLINAIAGRDVVDVGAVRASDNKGRHTTAWRELVLAPGGGVLIDSPGLRAVGMWIDAGGIDAAFSDVADLAADCRFSDCAHETEPGCAVLAAIASGDLDARRLESYRKLSREAAWAERRNDAKAAASERRVWAARSREAKERTRRR